MDKLENGRAGVRGQTVILSDNRYKGGTMETPYEYKQNFQAGKLTSQMIGDVLFSLSKRTKNAADKERQYKHSKPEYSLENRLKKQEYWKMYKNILTAGGFYPKEVYWVERFSEAEYICQETCLAYSEYLEALRMSPDPLFCECPCTSLCPDRHVKKFYLRTDYYLHYFISGYSFYTLSSEKEVKHKYRHLSWTKLDDMFFDGADIKDLLSMPFCRKVYSVFVATNENIF